MDVKIEASWKSALKAEFRQPYFEQAALHVRTEKGQGKTIYPPGSMIFNAFNHTPFDKVKVVILGQDPYHGPGQAQKYRKASHGPACRQAGNTDMHGFFCLRQKGGPRNTRKGTKNTERQATDNTDMHGFFCLRQNGLATKYTKRHKKYRKAGHG